MAQELHEVTAKPVVNTERSMVLTLQAVGVNALDRTAAEQVKEVVMQTTTL